MGKLLIIVLPVIGLLGGLAGGHFLAPKAEEAPDKAAGAEKPAAEGAEAGTAQAQGEDPVRPPDPPPAEGETEYARLSKQFIVPVIEAERVASLMVLDIAVEVGVGDTSVIAGHEPKLRDEFLKVLFGHAQSGGFSGDFTRPRVMNDLRASLDVAARRIVGPSARRVLVTGIIRQDY